MLFFHGCVFPFDMQLTYRATCENDKNFHQKMNVCYFGDKDEFAAYLAAVFKQKTNTVMLRCYS